MRHSLLIVLACAGLCPLAGAGDKAPAPGELIAEADRVRPDQVIEQRGLTHIRSAYDSDETAMEWKIVTHVLY